MRKIIGGVVLALTLSSGCATAPKTQRARSDLLAESNSALHKMEDRDSSLSPLLARSQAFVVFPTIGEGAAIVGGAHGRGIVYEHGQPIGFAQLSRGSLGAQIGGQEFAELIVLRDLRALRDLKDGGLTFGAEASGVIVETGAGKETEFGEKGVAVFVMPRAGLMANASLTSQEISYLQRESKSTTR